MLSLNIRHTQKTVLSLCPANTFNGRVVTVVVMYAKVHLNCAKIACKLQNMPVGQVNLKHIDCNEYATVHLLLKVNDQLRPNKKYVWFQLSHHPYFTPNPKLFLTFKWLGFYLLWDQPTQPGYMMLSHSTLFVRGYFKAWLEIKLKRHVSKMKEKISELLLLTS